MPLNVLISPLWPKTRIGWARSQLGNVFVENRECICINKRITIVIHNFLYSVRNVGSGLKMHTQNSGQCILTMVYCSAKTNYTTLSYLDQKKISFPPVNRCFILRQPIIESIAASFCKHDLLAMRFLTNSPKVSNPASKFI